MKKIALLLVLMVAIVASATVTWGWERYPNGRRWNTSKSYDEMYPNGTRWDVPNGYYYPDGYFFPTNVDVKMHESWSEKKEERGQSEKEEPVKAEEKKGERSFEQSPNLKAKVIDSLTMLGVVGLVGLILH